MNYVALSFLGIALWPSMEYGLHRFLGHEWKGKNLFYKEHTRHHATAFYFAPAKYKLMVAIVVVALLTMLSKLLLDEWLGPLIFISSFIGMYLVYEYVHYSIHAYAPKTPYGLWARKHHLAHHFHSPKTNHGVTTPWFDYVFKTHRSFDRVRVPMAFAPEWLKQNPKAWEQHFDLK